MNMKSTDTQSVYRVTSVTQSRHMADAHSSWRVCADSAEAAIEALRADMGRFMAAEFFGDDAFVEAKRV